MRAQAFAVALLVAICLAPPASAVGPLTLFVFVTPDGAAYNDTVNVTIEAFSWATPVDLGSLSATVDVYGSDPQNLTTVRDGVGLYHAVWVVPAGIDTQNAVYFEAAGSVATTGFPPLGQEASGGYNYHVAGPDKPAGLFIISGLSNEADVGYEPLPGDLLVFEARTYFDGHLESRGVPSANLLGGSPLGQATSAEELAGEEIGTGVFHYPFRIPANLTESTRFEFHAELAGYAGRGGSVSTQIIHPVPAVLVVENVTEGGLATRACADHAADPLENASVKFTVLFDSQGLIDAFPAMFANASTGQDGCAVAPFSPHGEWTSAQVTAFVEAYGMRTTLQVRVEGPDTPERFWQNPQPASSEPLQLFLASDVSGALPGQAASVSVRAEWNGAPLRNSTLAVLVSRPDHGSPALVSNHSTDSAGVSRFAYAVPQDWSDEEALQIEAIAPSGDAALAYLRLGPLPGQLNTPTATPDFAVTGAEDTANATLRVVAPYGGRLDLAGIDAGAFLVPLETRMLFPFSDGDMPWAALRWDGSALTGTLKLPGWVWEGDYLLEANGGNWGTGDVLDNSVYVVNRTIVHITPPHHAAVDALGPGPTPAAAPAGGTPPGSAASPLSDGFAPWWLFLAAGVAVFGWIRFLRRHGE